MMFLLMLTDNSWTTTSLFEDGTHCRQCQRPYTAYLYCSFCLICICKVRKRQMCADKWTGWELRGENLLDLFPHCDCLIWLNYVTHDVKLQLSELNFCFQSVLNKQSNVIFKLSKKIDQERCTKWNAFTIILFSPISQSCAPKCCITIVSSVVWLLFLLTFSWASRGAGSHSAHSRCCQYMYSGCICSPICCICVPQVRLFYSYLFSQLSFLIVYVLIMDTFLFSKVWHKKLYNTTMTAFSNLV